MNDSTLGAIFPSIWGAENVEMERDDTSLSRYYNAQVPSNDFMLDSWQADQDPSVSNGLDARGNEEDNDDIMVDIFYADGILDHPSTPPTGRLSIEEALEDTFSSGQDDDDASFFTTHSSEMSPTTVATTFLPIEERYQATWDKLAESMKKSQETRKSLRMKMADNVDYDRWANLSGTLSSIEKSTQQLQQYLKDKPLKPHIL